MKKVYTMLALALGLGLSATAAPELVTNKAQVANAEAILSTTPIGTGVAKAPAAFANGPAKAITSTTELEGMKKWSGTLMFGQKTHESGTIINGPQAGIAFVEDARETRITVNNFPSGGLSLRMNVDLEKKEVTIANGTNLGEVKTSNGIKECNIYVQKHTGIGYDEESGLWKFKEKPQDVDQAVGKILDDGSISFEGYRLMAGSPGDYEQGYLYLMLNTVDVVFEPISYNTPVESEYTYLGTGEYNDCFFRTMFKDPNIVPVNKKAQIYVKNEGSNIMIAVKNPYKNVAGVVPTEQGDVEVTDFWREIGVMYEEASGDGWLLFEVFKGDKFKAYPNAAACLVMVPCGMVTDDSEEGDGSELTTYLPYNDEGKALYSGGEEEVLAVLESLELDNKDYSKVENNVLTITNTLFGIGTAPVDPYWWGQTEHPVGTVTLPAGWDDNSGIESVAGDVFNAPVKYYNLQGIELAAPVKGQLVIKKQGNKTVKFIAK